MKRTKYQQYEKRDRSRRAGNQRKKPDFILLAVICLLVLWGIFTVAVISFPVSIEEFGAAWHYSLKQLAMLGIGFGLGLLFYLFPLEKLKKIAPLLFFGNFLLLLAVFIPAISIKSGGASRWLAFGSFSFQPSEFLKITFILYAASWLANRQRAKSKKSLGQMLAPFALMLAVLFAVLLIQPDMTTLYIITFTGILMYFVAATPILHTILLIGSAVAGGIVLMLKTPFRLDRLLVFLNPGKDPLGAGYQLRQSIIALGSGKTIGVGKGFSFGLGRQKFGFVPYPMTDSIFAIIGEELGFIGAASLVIILLYFTYRAFKIAVKSKDHFYKLTAVGITVWITFQAFFNIAGIIGVAPLGGVPLPFFSYGGSHLISELAAMGILLNISKSS